MDKLISCCGINCIKCEARIAYLNDDDELRRTTSKKWQKLYNNSNIFPDDINCTGCREKGTKFSYHSKCEIRKCVNKKLLNTCGDCTELNHCKTVSQIHEIAPETLKNLKK